MTAVRALIQAWTHCRCGKKLMTLQSGAVLVPVVHPPHVGERFRISDDFQFAAMHPLRYRMLQEPDDFQLAAMDDYRVGRSRNWMILSWQRWMLEELDALESYDFKLAAMDAVRVGCSRNRVILSWQRWML